MMRFAIGALVACATTHVHADEYTGAVPDRARALAERGRQLHHAHDYLDAIEAYKAAYVLAPSPNLLFDLAQSYRLAGDCADAAWMYRRFLDTDPAASLRTLAQNHLDDLANCNHGSFRVALDPGEVPETSTHTPPAADLVDDHDPGPSRAQQAKRTGTWLMGGGAAGLVIAGLFALDANAQQNAIEDAYKNHSMPKNVEDIDTRGQRDSTMAAIFGITGGVAAASGLALYLIGKHYETSAHISVSTASNGAAVGVRWRF